MAKCGSRCADKDMGTGPRCIMSPIELEERRVSSKIFTRKEIAKCGRIEERKLRFDDYLGMSGSSDTAYTT
jgi:hypothetical protein